MADLKAWSHGVRKANCTMFKSPSKISEDCFIKLKRWNDPVITDEYLFEMETQKYFFAKEILICSIGCHVCCHRNSSLAVSNFILS